MYSHLKCIVSLKRATDRRTEVSYSRGLKRNSEDCHAFWLQGRTVLVVVGTAESSESVSVIVFGYVVTNMKDMI